MAFMSRFKISGIVKNVILGQQGLVSEADELLIANNCRGVKEPAPVGQTSWSNRAHNCGQTLCRLDNLVQRLQNAAGNVAVEKPVQRCVSLNAGFRQHH
jgi:hypothetical protein